MHLSTYMYIYIYIYIIYMCVYVFLSLCLTKFTVEKRRMQKYEEQNKNQHQMDHPFGDMSKAIKLPSAVNVMYVPFDSWFVVLIVDLLAEREDSRIAVAQNIHVDNLPITLDFSVVFLNKSISANELAKAEVSEPFQGGTNVKWVVRGRMAAFQIDLSSGLEVSRANPHGVSVLLASVRTNTPLGKSNYLVKLRLLCEGGGTWPIELSPHDVARSSTGVSVSSTLARELDISRASSAPREMSAVMDHSGVVDIGENITLDERELPKLKLRLNLNGKEGKAVRCTGNFLSGIGVSLLVQCNGNSAFPLDICHGASKVLNVKAYEEKGEYNEGILVIEFDTTKEYGMHHGGSYLISNANHLMVNNKYMLNFTASSPNRRFPSFDEVYEHVCSFLDPMPNSLYKLRMPDVRAFVMKGFPHLAHSPELKHLIWEAVRWYVIMDYIPYESQAPSTLHVAV